MNKFSLDSIFLDKGYKTALEKYCIRKKIITRTFYDDKDVTPKDLEVTQEPLIGIKKLLIYLTLFENIDSNSSIYDFSRLVDMGVIKKNNSISSNKDSLEVYNDINTQMAINLMKIYRKDVIKYIKLCDKNQLKGLKLYSKAKEFWKNIDDNMRKFYCVAPDGEHIWNLIDDYEKIIYHCNACGTFDSFKYPEILAYNHDVANTIGSIRDNLIEGIYRSETSGDVFASSIFGKTSSIKNVKVIDDIYYTVRIHLPNEFNILPMPQTWDEMMKMRNSQYIRTYRKVFNEWGSYISKGEYELAAKMKKDIEKANRNLERLDKHKKFYNSFFTRVCKLMGGLIPYVSIALGTVDFLEPYGYEYAKSKNGWVLLTKE